MYVFQDSKLKEINNAFRILLDTKLNHVYQKTSECKWMDMMKDSGLCNIFHFIYEILLKY